MLNPSQLYTFIDQDKKFALYFLEGQKLIHDLVLKNPMQQGGFSYFRSAVLSVQLLLGLLKHGEYFCFYIDKDEIEVTCEYCKTAYRISEKDILKAVGKYQ